MTNNKMFSVQDKRLIITGAGGVIGSILAVALAGAGARLCILDVNGEKLRMTDESIKAYRPDHLAFTCNVSDITTLKNIRTEVIGHYGGIDGLLNIAGGASRGASTKTEFFTKDTPLEDTFFGVNLSDFQDTADLNFMGSVIPSLVFGEAIAREESGSIINISSMGAIRPLTKSPAYCAGKAAVTNFTLWLAVHLSKAKIRVNAIAPGFFLTDQNRYLLVDEATGDFTQRGKRIVEYTPLGKLGDPQDLISTVFWLLSDSSSFVTGAVIPVDGGFSAYCGV